MAEPEIRIKIKSQADTKAVEDTRKSFSELAREIPGVGKAMDLLRNPIALAVGAFTALAAGVRAAVKEFASAEEQSARLDAALARTGQLTDSYRESLHSLASELQNTTGIADDQWYTVLRKLTQFGATDSTIRDAAEAVKNLAGVMDSDVVSAAEMIGRAMEGNFELFSRLGINAKELNALYIELAAKGGGQLEARTETLTGKSESLSNAWSDLKEAAGQVVSRTGALQESAGALTRFFNGLSSAVGGTIDKLEGLRNVTTHTVADQQQLAAITREHASQVERLKGALDAVNQKYKDQQALRRELLDDEEKELASQRDVALAKLEGSGMTGPELAQARYQIEHEFAARGREIRDRRVAGEVMGARDEAQSSAQVVAAAQRRVDQAKSRIASAPDQSAVRKEIEGINKSIAPDLEFIAKIQADMGSNPVGDELKRQMIADIEARIRPQVDRRSALQRSATEYSADQTTVKDLEAALPGMIEARDKDIAEFKRLEARAIRQGAVDSRVDVRSDLASAVRARTAIRAADQDFRQSAAGEAVPNVARFVNTSTRGLNVMEAHDAELREIERRLSRLEQNQQTNPGRLK